MSTFTYDENGLFVHHSIDPEPRSEDFFVHAHECYELYYFQQGNAMFWVEGTPYDLHPGDIMMFNIAETHKICVEPTAPYERSAILFRADLLTHVDPDYTLLLPFRTRSLGRDNVLHPADFKDGYWKRCLQNLLGDAENRRLQITVNLLPLLNEVHNAFANKQEKMAVNQGELPQQILSYINENILEPLSADILTQHFSISKSYLFDMMKKMTGSTFWNYITVKRLLRARQTLLSGVSPTETSSLCGFQDYTTFFRAYKKHFGTSPKQDYIRKSGSMIDFRGDL